MTTLLSWLPIILTPLAFVLVLKLAAFIYRRTRLAWSHACVYTVLIAVASIALGLLNFAAGSPSPLLLLVAVSLICHALLGGWYLGPRAQDSAGAPITFPRGAILAAINLGILAAITLFPSIVFFIIYS